MANIIIIILFFHCSRSRFHIAVGLGLEIYFWSHSRSFFVLIQLLSFSSYFGLPCTTLLARGYVHYWKRKERSR